MEKEIQLANAALGLLSLLLPRIDNAVKNGQVSVEAQAGLRKQYDHLRATGDAAFQGPEWNIEG